MQEAILFLIEKDAVFKTLHQQYGSFFIPSRPAGFVTLCKLILEQQVSIDSAKATYLKIENLLGEVTPETIIQCSDEELKSCGVSRQKTLYLKTLAKAVQEELDLDSFVSKSSDEVRNELIKIKGIGHWTIDVYLMFALESPDIIPLGDIAVVNTIKELYDVHTKEEMEQLSQNWKPYRTMATFMLWHHYLEKRNRKPFV
ncbi:DNA-3-methyladenine glycosylase family protein [Flavobacterium wongokense]|uniref:DNA-3-methyladenine glycosylase family protein n=1 Tax=Flavobacterium wongokense TaxID=2910674 RepID=UPI001F33E546|nr:DNA-3-methyladenine glycosylase 2 family protein [Flavobacterium sp. WG47]MCF6133296.1 DNA-3-methyladenine glycosylase 2 family protein [Flavobacterium sp. WG47]